MSGIDETLPVLVDFGVLLSVGAAWLTGRAFADTWRPARQVVPAIILLTVTVRFLDYALFHGSLLSLPLAFWGFGGLLAIALTGYRVRLARKMVAQYPWLYRRAGPFAWREIKDEPRSSLY